jgi:hypothetical protein
MIQALVTALCFRAGIAVRAKFLNIIMTFMERTSQAPKAMNTCSGLLRMLVTLKQAAGFYRRDRNKSSGFLHCSKIVQMYWRQLTPIHSC